jgi:hypothetical protein
MNPEQIKAEIALMKKWCEDNYTNGADTMVECWADEDYAKLFDNTDCAEGAWSTLKDVAGVYAERQADAAYYRDIAG